VADYDLVIVGGGPAGLTAGIYAGRSGLRTLILEKGIPGGMITFAERVENFPGFPEGISGIELGERLAEQARRFGVEIEAMEALEARLAGEEKAVVTAKGEIRARAVIIATGSSHRHLGVPGEEDLVGRGVSYCATCDAPFFREREVAVVGGGDTAATEALYLSKFASKVFLVHRRNKLRAHTLLQARLRDHDNIEFLLERVPEEIKGEGRVEGMVLRLVKTGEKEFLPVAGVFVAVGMEPNSQLVKGQLKLIPPGYILTNELMETELPGVFAAGDVRHLSARQAVTSAADGAQAAISAYKYLEREG